jgi:transposase
MQIIYPRKELYQIKSIDETDYSKIVWQRKEKIDKIKLLLAEGCTEDVALQAMNVARSTYYRWKKNYKNIGLAGLEDESRRPNSTRKSTWTYEIEQRVYHLRKKFPLWGKAKIAVMYKRQFTEKISVSTVGRIIKKLIGQNKIMPVRFMYGKKDTKRRIFNGHAQRWKVGMKAYKPGELIQVDHMTITIPGFGQIKHFNAVCPITKYAVYQAYKEANCRNAADFLEHMKKEFPFPIQSIQVDGGSEFMGDFEKAVAMSNIPLWVLPPRMPEYNCNVERGNGTAKYEFYWQYNAQPNLHMIKKNLQKFALFYNTVRPHQGIGLLTPTQFYEVISNEALQSHMS